MLQSHTYQCRFLSFVIGLVFPMLSIGQHFYEGVVIDAATKTGIPFASLGYIKKNTGTNADELGRFHIKAENAGIDSLLVSCVGYEDKKVALLHFPADGLITLNRKPVGMQEVVINSKYQWKQIVLNESGNCGLNYWVGTNYCRQVAQHFYAPEENSILTMVQVCKDGIPIIAPNTCLFRIRIYTMDSITGKPSFDLTDSVIEVKGSGRHVQIELEKFNIVIPQHDFFVAVEWLKVPLNEYRQSYKHNGQKMVEMLYSPDLAVKQLEPSKTSKSIECWMLTYKNQWRPMPGSNAQITATLKY